MRTGAPSFLRRSLSLAAVCIFALVMMGCRGRGGGHLPPEDPPFAGPASFGFTFSCERSSRSHRPNPPEGQLHIQLSYTDHGANPIGSDFTVHGIVDTIDPVDESMACIGQEPPPDPGNKLIFLGRYWVAGPAPERFPKSCPRHETPNKPLCRFEVIVEDNDQNRTLSTGDSFSIKLSSVTTMTDDDGRYITEFPDDTVFYARSGHLEGGNITVD